LSTYDESVYASRWFIAVLVVAAAGSLFSAIDALRDAGGSRLLGAGLPALIAALLIAVAVVFGRLRTEAGGNGLRFHFGPFGRTLEAADIRAAAVVPYKWLRFGGWGIRLGRMAGHSVRAYSVPFLRTGVAVETRDGTRYYVSSRRPEALAAAINQAAKPHEDNQATRPREGQA
jgi:hypothetical protein